MVSTMRRWEWLARGLVLCVLIGLPLGLWAADRGWNRSTRWLVARIPESGGWQPPVLEVEAGKPLRLRVTSADVVHGLRISGLGVETLVEPGKVQEILLRPERPGRYRVVCTVVCSPHHEKMVAELRVRPPGGGPIPQVEKALPWPSRGGRDRSAPERLRPGSTNGGGDAPSRHPGGTAGNGDAGVGRAPL
jgi:hypothetical protein